MNSFELFQKAFIIITFFTFIALIKRLIYFIIYSDICQ